MKKEVNTRRNGNYLSLAGEFAVLSQLNLRGFDASLTLGNTKEVDILVSDPKSGRFKRIEVKTRLGSTKSGTIHRGDIGEFLCEWVMGEKHESLSHPDLLYCFVHFTSKDDSSPRFYIVPSEVVADYVKVQHVHWLGTLNRKGNQHIANPMRMFRIGITGQPYSNPSTPLDSQYLGRWDLI